MVVLALFQSAREYIQWLKLMSESGAIIKKNNEFSHSFEVGEYIIFTKLHTLRHSELEKFVCGFEPVWIMCKDFYPDELELNLFKSRVRAKNGAITSRELFLVTPDNIPESMRLIQ